MKLDSLQKEKASEDSTQLQNGAANGMLQAQNSQTFLDRHPVNMAHTMTQASIEALRTR